MERGYRTKGLCGPRDSGPTSGSPWLHSLMSELSSNEEQKIQENQSKFGSFRDNTKFTQDPSWGLFLTYWAQSFPVKSCRELISPAHKHLSLILPDPALVLYFLLSCFILTSDKRRKHVTPKPQASVYFVLLCFCFWLVSEWNSQDKIEDSL